MTASALPDTGLLVVKVGSSLIAGGQNFSLPGLAADLAERKDPVVVVSSGAVALGREATGEVRRGTDLVLAERQALAAIGQPLLQRRWREAFAGHGVSTAQILLTPDITDHRARYLNARATLRALIGRGVVPIINENDAVATDELRYGDNDGLAARVAGLIEADTLLLLSDIDGLYDKNPNAHKDAAPVPHVGWGDIDRYRAVAGPSGSSSGTGGMQSKIDAASLAVGWGVRTIIASGHHERPLSALSAGSRSTMFEPGPRLASRRRWLAGSVERQGAVEIDPGAVTAVAQGASLLSVGVSSVAEPFLTGDVVEVRSNGEPIAFGLALCDAAAISDTKVLIHRDSMVLKASL
ncbi:MAG: glutamate 5-kinase [Pseudomonadota bacterium]